MFVCFFAFGYVTALFCVFLQISMVHLKTFAWNSVRVQWILIEPKSDSYRRGSEVDGKVNVGIEVANLILGNENVRKAIECVDRKVDDLVKVMTAMQRNLYHYQWSCNINHWR